MARKQTATKESPVAEPAIDMEPLPAATPATAASPPVEAGERRPWPDVTELKTVRVSLNDDKLRLIRSRRYNQLQISSDGELPDWARKRLKDDGWRDRVEDEGIYTKQLPPRPKPAAEGQEAEPGKPAWPVVIDAERFFEDLANAIRAEHKMSPVRLNRAAEAER